MIVKTKSFKLAVNTLGDEKSDKIAILLPGRLDTKDYLSFDSHLKFFASKGFYAVSVDPPGTWDSPGGIELFTTTNYIKAVNELIDHLGNKSTLLFGHSRGGAIAIITGRENESVKAIVTVNASLGKPSFPDKSRVSKDVVVSYRDLPPGNKKTTEQRMFRLPLNYFKDGEKYDDAEVFKKCNKPKIMFYSTNDEFNTTKYVKGVFESAKEPKFLFELGGSHDYRYYPEAVEKVNKEVGELLNTNLKELF